MEQPKSEVELEQANPAERGYSRNRCNCSDVKNMTNDSKIIDGKLLAQKHEEKLKQEVKDLKITPQMVSFFDPNNPSCLTFTKMKQQKAQGLGIKFEAIELVPKFTTETVAALVKKFNYDPKIQGIMFQLPLPKKLESHQNFILNLIRGDKDVDGLTTHGKFLPATVKGVFSILNSLDLELLERMVAVVGSEGMVGKALVDKLKAKGVEVVEVDKKRLGTSLEDIKEADIIISCTGVEDLIKPEMIKNRVVLIDVGLGDFDQGCYEKASKYTPIKGGVGPMTVISLMENMVEAASLLRTEF